MLRARTYNQKITLTWSAAVVDEFGHASFSEPVVVGEVYARVEQMSAVKTMATFQQMDVVGLDIELRTPSVKFNGIRYRGHDVFFATPKELDRGRTLQMSGYYQTDNPKAL